MFKIICNIKVYLRKYSTRQHLSKIIKGIVGAIPFVGPVVAEYIPSENENNIHTSHNKETKYLSTKDGYITIDENGICEQQGTCCFSSLDLYINFSTPFANSDYFFKLENDNISLEIIEKTTTNIHLYSSKPPSNATIKWLAKGIS